jgi:hypothetical protein
MCEGPARFQKEPADRLHNKLSTSEPGGPYWLTARFGKFGITMPASSSRHRTTWRL